MPNRFNIAPAPIVETIAVRTAPRARALAALVEARRAVVEARRAVLRARRAIIQARRAAAPFTERRPNP